MECLHPVNIRMPFYDPETGERLSDVPARVPCGKCLACLHNRQMYWTMRIKDHLNYHPFACFVTLTYSPECYPGGVCKDDIKKFHDRMRTTIRRGTFRYKLCQTYVSMEINPHTIFRYYLSSEYGPHGTERGHYHAIYFIEGIDDPYLFQCLVETCWQKGYVTCDKVRSTGECVSYIANYLISESVLQNDENKHGNFPPFSLMSKSLGLDYVEQYRDFLLQGIRQYTVRNGRRSGMPRYYRNKVFGSNSMVKTQNTERVVERFMEFVSLSPEELARLRSEGDRLEKTLRDLDLKRLKTKGKL